MWNFFFLSMFLKSNKRIGAQSIELCKKIFNIYINNINIKAKIRISSILYSFLFDAIKIVQRTVNNSSKFYHIRHFRILEFHLDLFK